MMLCLTVLLGVSALSGARPDALSEFTKRSDRRISGHDTRTYCGISVEQCAGRCHTDSDYNCRSFEHDGGCCRTSESNTENDPNLYEERSGTDYYELKPGAWLDYYTEFKNHRLQDSANQVLCNLKSDDCGRKCMQATFQCRSFYFDRSFGCCYLSDKTRSSGSYVSSSSHDYHEVKSGALSDYFEVQRSHQLANNNDLVLCSVSVDDCQQRCLQETSFSCKSFDFTHSWGCCYLSSSDRTTASSSYQSASGIDYYQVKTGYRWRTDGRCGHGYSADLATPAECNPDGDYCCVNTRCQTGTCSSGADYRGWDRCGERECTCSSSDKRVSCNSRSLTSVDFFVPRSTRYLDLRSNDLHGLPVATLVGLNELTTLDLSNNHISTLPYGIMEDLGSLQTLKLNGNTFSNFDMGIVLNIPSLRNFYLSSSTRVRFTWTYQPETLPGVSCPSSNCYSACGDPSYLNGPQDWSRLQAHLVIKKLYFDLSELFYYVSDVTQSVTIYADTVVTSVGVSFNFALTINARQFWTDDGYLSFSLPSGQHSGPMVSCGLLDDNWRQINIKIGDRLKVNLVTNESYAMPYPCSQTSNSALTVQADKDVLGLAVQCARILADSHDLSDPRSLPLTMVDWTIVQARRGGAIGAVHHVAIQARSELKLAGAGYHYVPYMSMAVYQNMLSNYYSQINVYRQEYNRLMDRTQSINVRLEAARALLARVDDVTTLQEQDLADLEQEIERTKQTRVDMKARFEESKVDLDSARRDFEDGIEQYKQEQAAKAAFGFLRAILSIFTLGAQPPEDDSVEDIQELIGAVVDIANTIQELSGLFDDLADFDALLDETMAAVEDLALAEYENYILDVQHAADLHVSLVEWGNLKVAADVLLGHGNVQKIRGSGKYRRALSDTSQWGKAVSEQTIALAQMMVQYQSGQRWLKASERERDRIQAQISLDESRREISLETEAAAGMQAFQVKLGMNNILLDYCGSYFYFQFRQCGSSYRPSLSDDMLTLLQKINNANRDAQASLGSFTRVPQPFDDIQIHLSDSSNADDCQGIDSCPIDQLKQTGSLSFTLDLSNPTFSGWDRVRIERVRAYIRGAANTGSHLRVSISNSGEFLDRYQGTDYEFASLPVKRRFEYNPNGLPGSDIIVDGEVHQSFTGYFYQTTPFTTWIIQLQPSLNPGLDLSGVTRVEIHFKGSVVTNYRGVEVPKSLVINL
ncbi:glycerotoxin paralog 1-like [Branchiostoma floridae x Branchiostoma japonicum]